MGKAKALRLTRAMLTACWVVFSSNVSSGCSSSCSVKVLYGVSWSGAALSASVQLKTEVLAWGMKNLAGGRSQTLGSQGRESVEKR